MSSQIDNSTNLITADGNSDADGIELLELAAALAGRWKTLIGVSVIASAAGVGIATLLGPTYTATTTFIPPQQQSAASSALASLGALAAFTGAGSLKSPADQYVALMQSHTISDRIIDEFKLQLVYDFKLRSRTRNELSTNVRISIGKKDGLIVVEVDDSDANRAANMANKYVDELRRLTSTLAITEAQQRRVFFERQLALTRELLTRAQVELQSSGFTAGALKAEPKAAAEGYAKLKTEVTSAEVKLQTMRTYLSDSAAELQQAQSTVRALRDQLSKLTSASTESAEVSSDYVGKYREFKYQETLFELFSRQYELAKVDESREGALIQVVDTATPPDRKSKPKRALIALVVGSVTFLLLSVAILLRHIVSRAGNDKQTRRCWQAFRQAFKG